MAEAGVGKASVMKELNALLRGIEKMEWARRESCSIWVVERVLAFSEEYMLERDFDREKQIRELERIRRRHGIGKRKGSTSRARRTRRPTVRAPKKSASIKKAHKVRGRTGAAL